MTEATKRQKMGCTGRGQPGLWVLERAVRLPAGQPARPASGRAAADSGRPSSWPPRSTLFAPQSPEQRRELVEQRGCRTTLHFAGKAGWFSRRQDLSSTTGPLLTFENSVPVSAKPSSKELRIDSFLLSNIRISTPMMLCREGFHQQTFWCRLFLNDEAAYHLLLDFAVQEAAGAESGYPQRGHGR